MKISVCPSTLQSGFDAYSPKARKLLFDGRRVSPFLGFKHQDIITTAFQAFGQTFRQLSISGVQEKYGLVLDGTTSQTEMLTPKIFRFLKPSMVILF